MPSNTFLNLPKQKKNKIIRAANKEFARVPIEKASIKNIVETAGIARGSFYQYFEDKEDLFEYVMKIKMGNVENQLNDIVKQENGDIVNVFINIYDYLVRLGKIRNNNKFFKKIFENVKTGDDLMFTKKVEMIDTINQTMEDLYNSNKERINVKNKEEFKLVIEMLFAITRRRIVVSLKYEDSNKAREDFLKEIEFIKNGILKQKEKGEKKQC